MSSVSIDVMADKICQECYNYDYDYGCMLPGIDKGLYFCPLEHYLASLDKEALKEYADTST